jgi:hypothetical protein
LSELHKTLTYQQLYNRFWDEFIDSYGELRKKGLNPVVSLKKSKDAVGEIFSSELRQNQENLAVVLLVYNHLKVDFALIEKAIQIYYKDEFS